jgi:hypothetical protein
LPPEQNALQVAAGDRPPREPGEPAPDRWLLQVRGFAELSIEDADGRRVGPSRDPDRIGTFDVNIPGVSYNPGQVLSSVFVDRAIACTVTLTTSVGNAVNVYLDLFNDIGSFGTYFFRGVPVAPDAPARLRFDPADHRPGEFVSDSPDGGDVITTDAITLTRQARQVTKPPTTRLDIVDGTVTVFAEPSSTDCPILEVRVSTDGVTHRVYEGAFPVPEDAKVVMAYSEDVAGNLEYPGVARPVLGVSPSEIRFDNRRDVARVEVLNLDPLHVSGELDCSAMPDQEWVVVEGGRGKTPYTFTVRVADGEPHGRATILVRTATEGAVFAERTVSVVAE